MQENSEEILCYCKECESIQINNLYNHMANFLRNRRNSEKIRSNVQPMRNRSFSLQKT